MKALFKPNGKFYQVGEGEELPSVSTVLSALAELEDKGSRYALIKWRENEISAGRNPQAAADRGNLVHRYAEEYSVGLVPGIPEEVRPWILQLRPELDQLYKEFGGATHREQYCQGSWYAGQLDQAMLRLDGPSTILDFKSVGVPDPSHFDNAEKHQAALKRHAIKMTGYRDGSHEGVKKAFRQLTGYAAAWGDRNRIRDMNLVVVVITQEECFSVRKAVKVADCVAEWDSYQPLYLEAVAARERWEQEKAAAARAKAIEDAEKTSAMMETLGF